MHKSLIQAEKGSGAYRISSFQPIILSVKSFQPIILSVKSFQPIILSVKSFQPIILSVKSFHPIILSVKRNFNNFAIVKSTIILLDESKSCVDFRQTL